MLSRFGCSGTAWAIAPSITTKQVSVQLLYDCTNRTESLSMWQGFILVPISSSYILQYPGNTYTCIFYLAWTQNNSRAVDYLKCLLENIMLRYWAVYPGYIMVYIYIWYLCYLEEVAHLRSDIYGVKWYLVFGIYGMYSNQYTPGNPLLCSISLFTKYMSWYAVLGYRRFLAAVIEQQHRPLQTHPVTLPLPARSQLQLPLPVNQPILDHQPSAKYHVHSQIRKELQWLFMYI